MATAYLHRTPGGAGNQTTWTFSTWFKRGIIPASPGMDMLFAQGTDSNNYINIGINTAGKIALSQQTTSSWVIDLDTGTGYYFTDTSAWYHVVIAVDTTQTTDTDRAKLYVNGNSVSWSGSTSYPAEDLVTWVNGTTQMSVGYNAAYPTGYWTGNMAHTHLIDGTQYAASDFGEFDTTSGIWVPKTGPSVTYGTNGFFLKYASGAITTDSSGNGNTMTQVGTITTTKDTPDNNFCTMNPLQNEIPNATFTQGNNTIKTDFNAPPTSTIGLDSGKWYCEGKCIVTTSGTDWQIGINSNYMDGTGNELGHFANDWAYQGSDGNSRTNNTSTSYGDTYTTGDIIGIALDLTNNKLYFSKNGVWQDSGDPTSGATGTGALSISLGTGAQAKGYFFIAAGADSSAQDYTWSMNFGNGYFGTTVAGTETDDAGIGLFKYDVPAGYYAICTTNLGDQS